MALTALAGATAATAGNPVSAPDGPTSADATAPDPAAYDDILAEMEGDGTAADPYLVTNATELQAMAGDMTAQYRLAGDVNASETADWHGGAGFVPIGQPPDPPQDYEGTAFTGSLDGADHTITNLTVNRSDADGVGVFAYLTGQVRDLHMAAVDATGHQHVGGIVGDSGGATMRNVSATGSASGDSSVGGVAGSSSGTVEHAWSNATVESQTTAGGLVGEHSSGEIRASKSNGSVTIHGVPRAGGLVGSNWDHIVDSYSTASVTGDEWVGGLVGRNAASETVDGTPVGGHIERSYAAGQVTGPETTGGLVGHNEFTVTDTYFDETATDQSAGIGSGEGGGVTGLETANLTGLSPATETTLLSGEDWVLTGGYPALAWESVDPIYHVDHFESRIDSVNTSVGVGEAIHVAYTIENVGTEAGTQSLSVLAGGEVVETVANLSLNASATYSGNFTYTTLEDDQPSVAVGVATANDTATADVGVGGPEPAVDIGDFAGDLPDRPVGHEYGPVEVPVTESAGGLVENLTVTGEVTGETGTLFSRSKDLDALLNETRTVSFTGAVAGEVGNYTATVTVDGEGIDPVTVTETFRVEQPATAAITALDVAGVGPSGTVGVGADEDIAVNVTNVGERPGSFEVTVDLGTVVTITRQTGTLDPGATERVAFQTVTAGLGVDIEGHEVTVATADEEVTGTLAVSVAVLEGSPARDTTGDGLLNDVRGDNSFDAFDVQTLFENLDSAAINDHPDLFDFQGDDSESADVFDVQALFNDL